MVYVYTASSLGKKSYLRTSEGRYQKMSQKTKQMLSNFYFMQINQNALKLCDIFFIYVTKDIT